MTTVVRDASPPSPRPTEKLDAYQLSPEAAPFETRNFFVIALYQIIIRTGWIFKTESIVMPAILDVITGGGWYGGLLRGLLPVLNRLGQSVPPLLVARRLKVMPRKRLSVLRSTIVMAVTLLALAAAWGIYGNIWWMSAAFLIGYAIFFAATGINNLSLGTLQGKLIHATRRGRLLTVANSVGAVVAIAAAGLLMPLWMSENTGQFDMIFGFSGLTFVVAALCVLLIEEPADDYHEPSRGMRHVFGSAWQVYRNDANFRRLAWVSMAYSSSLVLFPHYQALARSDRLRLTMTSLVTWVIVQNIGTGFFSVLTGPASDRRGNRLVMQWVMLTIAAMPPAAIALSYAGEWGRWLYPGIFFFLGITPVGLKTLNNYTLEIAPTSEHPKYLATVGLFMAAPLFFSPFLGFLAEVASFELVFFGISALMFYGWLMTFRLREPREAFIDEVLASEK